MATEGIPPNESKNLECPRNACIRNLEVVGSQLQPQVVYNMCFMCFILTNRSTSWFQMDHIYLNRRMFIHIFPFGSPTPKSSNQPPCLATHHDHRLLKRPSARYLKKWALLGELSNNSLASPGWSEKNRGSVSWCWQLSFNITRFGFSMQDQT